MGKQSTKYTIIPLRYSSFEESQNVKNNLKAQQSDLNNLNFGYEAICFNLIFIWNNFSAIFAWWLPFFIVKKLALILLGVYLSRNLGLS